MARKNRKGFTLVEAVVALAILVFAMSMAMSGYIFLLKNADEADTQNELDNDVQLTIERLKKDIRLSTMNEMFFYPETPPFTAISFPIAYDDEDDSDDMIERDEKGRIIWDETVIYHIRQGTPNQLVRTTFSPRDESLSHDERQKQLNDVVAHGDGSATYNRGNAKSMVLFSNLLDWELSPSTATINTYAETETEDTIFLGYIMLDPDSVPNRTHKIRFKASGQDSASGGYELGIDRIEGNTALRIREAEDQVIQNQQGASAVRLYGGLRYDGGHILHFPATQVGNEFSMDLKNDRIEETNFGGVDAKKYQTVVDTRDDLNPIDTVVQLEGMTACWEASAQTAEPDPVLMSMNQSGKVIRTLLKSDHIACKGMRACLTFRAPPDNPVQLDHVFFGESFNNSSVLAFNSAAKLPVTFSNTGTTTTKADIPAGGIVTSDWINIPITNINYLVSYEVVSAPSQLARIDRNAWPSFPNPSPIAPATTQIATPISVSKEELAKSDAPWKDAYSTNDVAIQNAYFVPFLESATASFVDKGTYTSAIYDTKLESPTYGDISWNAIVPGGTRLAFKVRSGSTPEEVRTISWNSATTFDSSRTVPGTWKRYIQFQTLMASETGTHLLSPILKDVAIDWNGVRKLVNISGEFIKGPNGGMYEITVDGKELQSALIVDLEIFKDIQSMDGKKRTATSAIKVELSPRNTQPTQ